MTEKTTYPKNKIKVLLLENIHPSAVKLFQKETFIVQSLKESLSQEKLLEIIPTVHILGIRSKTKVTKSIIEAGKKLKAIGCFCIGTDQVDLEAARDNAIPVFNSPFANTRSVAELVIAEIIMLSRKIFDKSSGIHNGKWNKSSTGCFEVRAKTLGIIGYGHVGSQLSILAESMGMIVQYYDIQNVLPLGNSKPVTLDELLSTSLFVSVHVPKTKDTYHMISKEEIKKMKDGSFLINAARGDVVVVEDLADALKSGKLGGAAVDVYSEEPEVNLESGFKTALQGCPNTILTPHIGGSTEEAQEKIGLEVTKSLIHFINDGSTISSVNVPSFNAKRYPNSHRLLHFHKNVPGVMKEFNTIFSDYNVLGQVLGTMDKIGYVIIDIESNVSHEAYKKLKTMKTTIKVRKIY